MKGILFLTFLVISAAPGQAQEASGRSLPLFDFALGTSEEEVIFEWGNPSFETATTLVYDSHGFHSREHTVLEFDDKKKLDAIAVTVSPDVSDSLIPLPDFLKRVDAYYGRYYEEIFGEPRFDGKRSVLIWRYNDGFALLLGMPSGMGWTDLKLVVASRRLAASLGYGDLYGQRGASK